MSRWSARTSLAAAGCAAALVVVAVPSLASSATVSAVAPSYGPVGTVVDITGIGLTGATDVAFGGVDAGVPTVIDDTHLQATVPSAAATGPVTVTASDGTVVTGPQFTVQVPTTATLARSTLSLTVPAAVTLTATIVAAGKPAAGQVLRLRRRIEGTTTWAQVGVTKAASSAGVASWVLYPRSTADYAVDALAAPAYGATSSTPLRVWVHPLVRIRAPDVAPILTSTPIRGTVRPVPSGDVLLYRYRSGAWHHAATTTLDSRGGYVFHVRFPATGVYTYRVRRPADGTHLAGTSATVRVTAVKRTLREGMSGPDVLALQKRLRGLHYDVGAVTGRFGYDTFHAVTAFEKEQGLTRDGVVGPRVWRTLVRPRIPHLLHPIASGGAIEVDLTRQVVYYAVDGHIRRIIDASTGGGYYYYGSDGALHRAITPTGHWHVVYKVDHWVVAPLGTLYRPAYFNWDGYALHGEGAVPPYPASHGCVRITVPAMDRLYAKLFVGISVWIYRT